MTVMERRRAVVTGVGVVASPGVGREMFWKGLSEFPGAGPHEVRNWDPEPAIPRREARRLDRFAQFAVIAAEEALSQAGELDVDPNRVTVNVASGIGGLETLEVLIGPISAKYKRIRVHWGEAGIGNIRSPNELGIVQATEKRCRPPLGRGDPQAGQLPGIVRLAQRGVVGQEGVADPQPMLRRRAPPAPARSHPAARPDPPHLPGSPGCSGDRPTIAPPPWRPTRPRPA